MSNVRVQAGRLMLEGAVDAGTVPRLLAAASEQWSQAVSEVDFAGVGQVDSSAIALALGWVREARAGGRSLTLLNLPPAMVNLARLYGVEDLLIRQS